MRRTNLATLHGLPCHLRISLSIASPARRLHHSQGIRYAGTEAGVLVCSRLEEDTVALLANLGENGCRGLRRVRDKLKILLFCAPLYGCQVLDDPGIKVVHIVVKVNMTLH